MTTYLKGVRETLSTYDGSSTDTDNAKQRLSGELWRDFDFGRALADPSYGWFSRDPWKRGPTSLTSSADTGPYEFTQATAGTVKLIDGPAGFGSLLELDCNSGTATQGVNIQFDGDAVYLNDGQTLYFETQLRFKDVATGPEFFAGFATQNTTAIITGSNLATVSWIGFYMTDDGTGLSFGMDDNSTAVAHSADAYTMVDGVSTTDGSEWVHLGFRWTGGDSCEFYTNGVGGDYDGGVASDPTNACIAPAFVVQSNGSTDSIVEIAHTNWAVKY